MIERLKPHGDGFVDEDDVFHSTEADFLASQLGICGCGRPEVALKYIYDSMMLIEHLTNGQDVNADCWYEEWKAARFAHFGGDGAEYFMWYWLDHNGYTEHGSSVPGWLTDDGKLLLTEIAFVLEKEKDK
jgi:hypothetical protein